MMLLFHTKKKISVYNKKHLKHVNHEKDSTAPLVEFFNHKKDINSFSVTFHMHLGLAQRRQNGQHNDILFSDQYGIYL